MNILCAYYDPEPDHSATDPKKVLQGHSVTRAHDFVKAMRLLEKAYVSGMPFDVLMCDCVLPRSANCRARSHGPLLVAHADSCGVKATGIFLPRDFPASHFNEDPENGNVLIASNACWTRLQGRDWQRLLRLLCFRLKRIGLL